jgi:iron complex outermembrane receptor protein
MTQCQESARFAALVALGAMFACGSAAQTPPAGPATAAAPSIVVTATRSEHSSFDLPVSIDRIDAEAIRDGRPMFNLSESLPRVPGLVVQNRQNYSQDLQISSRGFGARAQFGVRGVRLYADGIPATSPDGQGQTSNFDLNSAERIEVMRGPFSTLYGNASGGVIQVFTENGPPEPTFTPSLAAGSYGTLRWGAKLGGQSDGTNYVMDASRFNTDGYRDHSAAEKDLINAKFGFRPGEDTRVNLIVNSVAQPAQDPAGLSRSQVEQNPRQVNPTVLQFNTKKNVRQDQLGTTLEQRLSASDSLRFAFYGGSRQVEQFLAIPIAAQNPVTSSGAVVNLDRGYYGLDLRWTHGTRLASEPFSFTVGTDYDYQKERRRGYMNNFGSIGALKRDEDDSVHSAAVYAQGEWKFAPDWSAHAGVRRTEVRFTSRDYFIVPATANGDDSGRISFTNTSPAAGVVYRASPDLNFYGNIGKGFETPTFAELAYQNNNVTGLNFALKPSTSVNSEIGAKLMLANGLRLNFAVFHIETNNEIVVDIASGGRNTFKNAGRTTRDGAEWLWNIRVLDSVDLLAALAYVDARYRDDFTSNGVTTSAGSYIPGVPRRTAYGEARFAPPGQGWSTAFELRYSDRIFTSDANSEFAYPYTVFNWRAVFDQRLGRWRFTEFLRVENLFSKSYTGSVIVGDANGRFYEPAPPRNYIAGITASLPF